MHKNSVTLLDKVVCPETAHARMKINVMKTDGVITTEEGKQKKDVQFRF